MSLPHLIIGNKNYSSWSFRPWLAMSHSGIEFEETVSPFDETNHNRHFMEFSPVGRVPVLRHDGLVLWESLAIMEYLAERFPDAQLWPQDVKHRANARVICHEMHAGFAALRSSCPMNMRRPVAALEVDESVKGDVDRIEELCKSALDASGGPFLFGRFGNADAMYAPVVNRLHIYELSDDSNARSYMKTMMALESWKIWEAAARQEPWVVDEEEV